MPQTFPVARHHVHVKGYPAKTVRGAVSRGAFRLALLCGLASIGIWMASDETGGNKAFLWVLAALALGIAAWGVVETWRELRLVRGRQD